MAERTIRDWQWLLLALLALGAVAVGLAWARRSGVGGRPTAVLPPADFTIAKPRRVSVLFGGDTHFGESYFTDPARPSAVATRGYDYPLEGIASLAATADFAVLNLETPLTVERDSPLRGKKRWVHWGDPERSAAALAQLGVRAASLANNHAFDAAASGLSSTRAALTEHGIRAFGAGLTLAEAALPFRADIRVGTHSLRLVVIGAYEITPGEAKSGWYAQSSQPGANPLDGEALAAQIRALKEADPKLYVVAYPHWGKNYVWRSSEQARLGHLLVDAGADLVLGHGAHLFQEIEPYHGRIIAYSLGNFVFLSPGRYKGSDVHSSSLVARLDFSEQQGAVEASLALYPIASDNRETHYQPKLLRGEAFEAVSRELLEKGELEDAARDRLRRLIRSESDAVGDYLRVDLGAV